MLVSTLIGAVFSAGRRRPPAQSLGQAIDSVARGRRNSPKVNEAFTTVGIRELADTPVSQPSPGHRTRLSLAIAIVRRPSIVCFDEPTAHVGADGRETATRVVAGLGGQGRAVLLANQ
jgi:ABC-type multidrug transport system ATPase subunit